MTFADLLVELQAPVVLVTSAGLGTLNHTALTLEAMATRGLECAGVVIGAWPEEPDLADLCNVADLQRLSAARWPACCPWACPTCGPRSSSGWPGEPVPSLRRAVRCG